MPLFVTLDLLQPIGDYIDIKNPMWDINAMENFKTSGRYYAVPDKITVDLIYFNKTLFDNNGLETPMEYYKKSQWNWSNFRKTAMALTQDTDRDGVTDQWGYVSSGLDQFLVSNGTDIVKYDKDGKRLSYSTR